MGENIPREVGGNLMWYQKNGFLYKEMKYQNSCFPCSLHVILANLNIIGHQKCEETVIEDLWNKMHKDLNKSAPNELQVHEYLSNTLQFSGSGVIFTPTNFKKKQDAQKILKRVKDSFLSKTDKVGMIAGINHAEVFYKDKSKMIHFNPSTDVDSIIVEEIKIKDIILLEASADHKNEEDYAIGIEYSVGKDVYTQASNFIAIIKK